MRAPIDGPRDHAAVLEHPHVARDRGLRHAEAASRLADRRRATSEPLDDAAPDRVGERAKRIVSHFANYTAQSTRTPAMPSTLGRTLRWCGAQTPRHSITRWATLPPENCCWPVMSWSSRTANALNRPA